MFSNIDKNFPKNNCEDAIEVEEIKNLDSQS